jgi:hypothetical protein
MSRKEEGTYFVFEMSARDRKQPLRQVNKSPLTLEKAKKLARIGAEKGKHDRAVTTSPASRSFRIVAQYAAGKGKDVSIMYRRGSGGGKRKKREPTTSVTPNEITSYPEAEPNPVDDTVLEGPGG